ncbi:hypothetical protein P4050_30640 [Pseudomonas aeruginosa]|nr:hypothetical protein [Pseudomonas aeruginosa]
MGTPPDAPRGDAALLNLQLQHTNERAQSLQDSLVQYKQQVARAAQAEEQLLRYSSN